jgi:hypothetical protein
LLSYIISVEKIKVFKYNIRIYTYSLLFIIASGVIFVVVGSYQFKVDTLKFLGFDDVSQTKRLFSSIVYRCITRFDNNIEYKKINNLLWSVSFDSKDPDNGWGIGNYKTVFPLTGKNVEIVPQESIGYRLDSTSTYAHSESHIYLNTLIYDLNLNELDSVIASVYCYVSEDFNGGFVCLRADGDATGHKVQEYEYKDSGVWQKLQINFVSKGKIPISLYFNKEGDTLINKLKGYVIFAYPQLSINNKSVSDRSYKNSGLSSINISTGETFSDLRKDHSYQNATLLDVDLMNLLKPNIVNFRKLIKSKDDTTYIRPKNAMIIPPVSDFYDDRLSRWQFAFNIFNHEYNTYNKLFGQGFNHLNWYGFYFLNDKTKSDWPHNPFLSILLYSGIFGLLIYCFFLYKVFYYYIRYIKEYPLLFIFFLITFFFAFFSSGSPFDPPVFGFFSILPFFIHSVHKREKGDLQKQND